MSEPVRFDEEELNILMEAMDKEVRRVQRWTHSKSRTLNEKEAVALVLQHRSLYAKLKRMLNDDRTAVANSRVRNFLKEEQWRGM